VELLKTFHNTIWKLSKTRLACMAIHAQKQNLLLLSVGRKSLLANGATPRSEPAEYVLPIIQRLLGYAQLAGWLANPRRCMYMCVYMCAYMCVYVCIYMCAYMCVYVCIYGGRYHDISVAHINMVLHKYLQQWRTQGVRYRYACHLFQRWDPHLFVAHAFVMRH
jgi:hypothetical protein